MFQSMIQNWESTNDVDNMNNVCLVLELRAHGKKKQKKTENIRDKQSSTIRSELLEYGGSVSVKRKLFQ